MAPTISADRHAALLSDLTHAATSLGWHVGITVAHCSVSAHRVGTDAAGGEAYAQVIGNADGWHYSTVDRRGRPMVKGTTLLCSTAMERALPFDHTELHP